MNYQILPLLQFITMSWCLLYFAHAYRSVRMRMPKIALTLLYPTLELHLRSLYVLYQRKLNSDSVVYPIRFHLAYNSVVAKKVETLSIVEVGGAL